MKFGTDRLYVDYNLKYFYPMGTQVNTRAEASASLNMPLVDESSYHFYLAI